MTSATNELTRYTGKFYRRLFRSDDDSHCVLLYQDKGDTVRLVGSNLPEVTYPVTFEGQWKTDPKYGRQFVVENVVNALPQAEKDIILFLTSLKVGIGTKTAKKMIALTGPEQFFTVLNREPSKFLTLKGVTERQLDALSERSSELVIRQDLLQLFAGDLPLDTRQYKRIHKFFGTALNTAVATIRDNPFVLMRCGYCFTDLDYFGARHTSYAVDDHRRLLAAAQQALLDAKQNAHVALPLNELRSGIDKLLERQGSVAWETIDAFLEAASASDQLVLSNDLYYLPRAYQEECQIASALARMVNKTEKQIPRAEFNRKMAEYAVEKGFTLSNDQTNAVWTALNRSICIITGGPGTGKSTILDALLYCWRHFHDDQWLLMAPTGKAAVRMTETTQEPATTVHSSLGLKVGDEDTDCMDTAVYEQLHSLIVLDECSMLDQTVTASLTLALKDGFQHLVLVGDPEQLPSVGWGNVLADLIESNVVPICRLGTIYRQGKDNPIITNSQRMLQGITELDWSNPSFKHFHTGSDASNMDATCRFFKRCVDAYGIENTMLLSPYRRATDICTNRLNKQLQETINPYTGQPEVSAKDNKFRLRDRVIQLRNTETLSNGDIGTVIQAYPGAMEDETCLTVEFESGVKQEYRKEDLNQLDLAYALTVHKSQGSQARAVVIILPCRFTSFLKRNVLYTAITRSSQYVAIFGPQETIASCILNNKKDERHTNLVAQIREAVRTITTRKGAA